MQIGTKQFYQSQITSMADLQSKIGRIQEEVSAGKKLLAPSDDPGSYTVANRLDQSIAAMDQYNRNISMAKTRLVQEDSVLSSVSTIVIRLNELGIKGANSTNDSTARFAISQEMDQLSQELIALEIQLTRMAIISSQVTKVTNRPSLIRWMVLFIKATRAARK